jgi:hypothetical protein
MVLRSLNCVHFPGGGGSLPRSSWSVIDGCRVDHELMRQEADEFFGAEDRSGDDDPWERRRG